MLASILLNKIRLQLANRLLQRTINSSKFYISFAIQQLRFRLTLERRELKRLPLGEGYVNELFSIVLPISQQTFGIVNTYSPPFTSQQNYFLLTSTIRAIRLLYDKLPLSYVYALQNRLDLILPRYPRATNLTKSI